MNTPKKLRPLFINLTPKEEEGYRKWAQDNYKPLSPIKGIWHPTVQNECAIINSNLFGTNVDK